MSKPHPLKIGGIFVGDKYASKRYSLQHLLPLVMEDRTIDYKSLPF